MILKLKWYPSGLHLALAISHPTTNKYWNNANIRIASTQRRCEGVSLSATSILYWFKGYRVIMTPNSDILSLSEFPFSTT